MGDETMMDWIITALITITAFWSPWWLRWLYREWRAWRRRRGPGWARVNILLEALTDRHGVRVRWNARQLKNRSDYALGTTYMRSPLIEIDEGLIDAFGSDDAEIARAAEATLLIVVRHEFAHALAMWIALDNDHDHPVWVEAARRCEVSPAASVAAATPALLAHIGYQVDWRFK